MKIEPIKKPKIKGLKTSRTASMLGDLRAEQIKTWFDLGLFIDQMRDDPPKAKFPGDLNEFKHHIEAGGVGLLSFYFFYRWNNGRSK